VTGKYRVMQDMSWLVRVAFPSTLNLRGTCSRSVQETRGVKSQILWPCLGKHQLFQSTVLTFSWITGRWKHGVVRKHSRFWAP